MRRVIRIESKDDHHILFQRLECVEVKVSCIFSIRLCMRIIFICFLIDLLMLKNLLWIHFITRKVLKVLLQLNTSKFSGPDGISARVLKSCAPELAPILNKLFQLSYNLGIFPSSWKLAPGFPIPQKGDKSEPLNYRPIAITSLISKTMETIITKQLLAYVETNSLLSDHQNGFRQASSTGDLLVYAVYACLVLCSRILR